MPVTRGGLTPARIGKEGGSPYVDCMFNPSEYAVNKTSSFSPGNAVGQTTANRKFEQGQPRTLTLKLYFDTYQDGPQAEPVTKYTDTLFNLMTVEANDANQNEPPTVEFSWGEFKFKGFLKTVKVNFTLFAINGTPLRGVADITMEEKAAAAIAAQTAARGWEGNSVRKTADASITGMAAQFTGDASNYRVVAALNNIDNPLKIKNGAIIKIPTNVTASASAQASFSGSASLSASASLNASASASASFSASASASGSLNGSASASASFSASASGSVKMPRRP
jgi:hypothetical protein